MRVQRAALTFVEMLVVITIVIVVTAILVPVVINAKKGARITKSISQMRQLYTAVEIYRADNDGNNGAYKFENLAFPPWRFSTSTEIGTVTLIGLPESIWVSPCGLDWTLVNTGPTLVAGWVSYGPAFYSPESASSPGSPYYEYLALYEENAVVFADHNCNEPGTDLFNPTTRKRALAILLSGSLVNRIKVGAAGYLHFYSEPVNGS